MSIFTYSKPYTFAFWSLFYNPPTVVNYDKNESKKREMEHLAVPLSTLSYILRQLPVSFSSGMLAGFSTSFIASPFELTKLGSQIELVIRRRAYELEMVRNSGKSNAPTDAPHSNSTGSLKSSSKDISNSAAAIKPLGTTQIVKQLVKKSGWMSLYSGFRYMIIRDGIGSGVYFGVYDSIRSAVSLLLFNSPEPHPVSVAIAGGLSGAFSWVVVYPLDTIKSRYQRDVMTYVLSKSIADSETGHADTVKSGNSNKPLNYPKHPKIKLSELFHKNMYRGLSISLIRTSVLGMCMFSCYEKLMQITA